MSEPASHPVVRAVGRALPPHRVDQETIVAALRALWEREHFNVGRFEAIQRAVRVQGRNLALPLAEYQALDGFGAANDAWIRVATEIGEAALGRALAAAGLEPRALDHLLLVTVTGIATPSIEVRIANRMGLRPDLRRTPIFGLGCLAGAVGLGHAADWLRGRPGGVAALLAVELCSLTLQRRDLSLANVVASGLFGDGAAAAVLTGAGRDDGGGPRVVAARSILYPASERVMGWDVGDGGLKVVLSAEVPELVRRNVGRDVDGFLGAHGLARGDVRHWIVHTGGPKVLEAFADGLGLPAGALERSWRSLAEVGNLSSASVLFVLADLLEAGAARPGDLGVLAAFGPGFAAELVLLRW